MTKYLDPNQSEARDRQLKRYLSNSIEKSTGSVNILTDVRKDFETWRELTQTILGALNHEYGQLELSGPQHRGSADC